MKIPLFPLNTVLFPGGPLPLRVFESRYLDMVSDCLKRNRPFGVLLIREGSETGVATPHDVGTTAAITDWYQGSDGILGITAIGEERFRVVHRTQQADGLHIADVELLAAEDDLALPAAHQGLAEILNNVLDDLGRLYEGLPRHPDDAVWVSNRFLEVLPIDLEDKQRFLESIYTLARLQFISESLAVVRKRSN